MNKFGFIKVAAATAEIQVADIEGNTDRIISMAREAIKKGASVCLFSELSICGFSVGDLLWDSLLHRKCEQALERIANEKIEGVVIVGFPARKNGKLYDASAVIANGEILGIVPRRILSRELCRWFSAANDGMDDTIRICKRMVAFSTSLLFNLDGMIFGVEIGDEMAAINAPSQQMVQNGAHVVFCPCARREESNEEQTLCNFTSMNSWRLGCGYILSSAPTTESTTDCLFSGKCLIAQNGGILAESQRFSTSHIIYSDIDIDEIELRRMSNPLIEPSKNNMRVVDIALETKDDTLDRQFSAAPLIDEQNIGAVFTIQQLGLARRIKHTNVKNVVIGISGGLDSTLALLVTCAAFHRLSLDAKGIVAVTMPGFGTTDRTYQNALDLMQQLGVSIREISIRDACLQHFKDISLDANDRGAAYENSQARERTQILMDVANAVSGFVVGTGDLSEASLGWETYNGDHMSMYNVNCSLSKTLVKEVVRWIADNHGNSQISEILHDILTTPISPELLPSKDGEIEQKTENLVGPYELHDFFIYHMMYNHFSPQKTAYLATETFRGRFSKEEIDKWINVFYRRFFSQQYKRSASPDGIRVGKVSLSPRGDWSMPSDAKSSSWLEK
ncbi:MAG: NAD(+) synthase [Alistipes sp.]|nr:NAD(+) synthase [Candidatus Alistipes equi]